jgi:hypothetical protein
MKYPLIIFMAIALLPRLYAIDLVVPNDKALTEGDGNNGFPFTESTWVHYQQVYDASQFTLLGTNGGSITSIGFRYNGNYNTAPLPYYSMTISLSTTTKAVDNLSGTFSDNVGADSTVVFSGKFIIGVTPPPSDGQLHPWPFPLTIPFNTSFQYNPTNGNLLLDIQWTTASLYAGNGAPWMDAVHASDDSVSRVFAYNLSEPSIPTNGTTSTIGLVTLFGVSPAAPPSPQLSNPAVAATNLLFRVKQGAPGVVCYLLSTTNMALPLANWSAVATNTFDLSGNCVSTNEMNTGCFNQFFILQLQ